MTLSKELHNHITSQATGHWIRQCLWFFVLHISKSMSSSLVEKHMKTYSCSTWFYSKDPNPGHRYTQACISLKISCGFGFSIHALGEETWFWFKQTMDNPLPIRQLAAICQRLPHDRS